MVVTDEVEAPKGSEVEAMKDVEVAVEPQTLKEV